MKRTPGARILTLEEAAQRYGRPRERTVVFTNGCFDLLHRGHVESLEYARSLGDRLVVGVNSDRSVRTLKGEGRPVHSEEDRLFILAALRSVDAVVLFDALTPLDLIQAILPDVLVKGEDYRGREVVGALEVEAAGGRVVFAPLVPNRSTTNLVGRITDGSSL